jgi:hypothetical protein
MTGRTVFASRRVRATGACAIAFLLGAAGPVFADDCAQQLAAAKTRRTHGRAMATVGVVGALYGYVAWTFANDGSCGRIGCSSTDRNIGVGGVVGGVTLAGFGFEKSHHGDEDARGLVVQDACIQAKATTLAIADAQRSPGASPSPGMVASQPDAAWARVVADAKARRSVGHKMLGAGLVALFVGNQVILHSSNSGQALLGATTSMVGLTAAISGHLKARDAGRDLDALTARGPSPGGGALSFPTGMHQSVAFNVGPDSRSLAWRITW